MNRKGEVKWEKILEYGLIIIFIAAVVIVLIGNILEVNVVLNTNTLQRQANLLADYLLASNDLIVTTPFEQKGIFDANKLNNINECRDLTTRYTDAPINYGIKVIDITDDTEWKICGSLELKQAVYPVAIRYSNGKINPGKLVITYE